MLQTKKSRKIGSIYTRKRSFTNQNLQSYHVKNRDIPRFDNQCRNNKQNYDQHHYQKLVYNGQVSIPLTRNKSAQSRLCSTPYGKIRDITKLENNYLKAYQTSNGKVLKRNLLQQRSQSFNRTPDLKQKQISKQLQAWTIQKQLIAKSIQLDSYKRKKKPIMAQMNHYSVFEGAYTNKLKAFQSKYTKILQSYEKKKDQLKQDFIKLEEFKKNKQLINTILVNQDNLYNQQPKIPITGYLKQQKSFSIAKQIAKSIQQTPMSKSQKLSLNKDKKPKQRQQFFERLIKHVQLEQKLRKIKFIINNHKQKEQIKSRLALKGILRENLLIFDEEYDPYYCDQQNNQQQIEKIVINFMAAKQQCEQHWKGSCLNHNSKEEIIKIFEGMDFLKKHVLHVKDLVREISCYSGKNYRVRDVYKIYQRMKPVTLDNFIRKFTK